MQPKQSVMIDRHGRQKSGALAMTATGLLLFALCFLISDFLIATPPPLPEFPPLHFNPPKPSRYVLENGLVVYLLEDHELPLIRLDMDFQAGTQYDPIDKVGLGSIFGEAMTEGGSLSHPPEEIEKILDRKAASISFSVGLEDGGAGMSSRKEDFDVVFGLFSDLMLHPQFRKDKFELARAKALEGLRRMNDDPEEVAKREFRRVMYGNHHPYARIPSPEMLKNIKRDDLLAAHKRFFRPNGSWIAVSGDFLAPEMLAKLKSALGSWAKADVSWPDIPAPAATTERRVFYIQKNINQSQIRIGDLGLARHSPDHFSWEVFNELWGGSATSRLFQTVRTELGLAYSVGSGFSEPEKQGLIVAVSQTRGSQTIAAAQAMFKIGQDVREAPFTAKEDLRRQGIHPQPFHREFYVQRADRRVHDQPGVFRLSAGLSRHVHAKDRRRERRRSHPRRSSLYAPGTLDHSRDGGPEHL